MENRGLLNLQFPGIEPVGVDGQPVRQACGNCSGQLQLQLGRSVSG
jgi:hypothetical protein